MKNTQVLNIAHRGARSLAPENTLAAAQKAFELGADMWELDVSVTADGELILIHDDTLLRTTNAKTLYPQRAPWHFTTFTLKEIKTLDAGSFYVETDPYGQIAAGAVSPAEQLAMTGLKIPTLHEALQFTRENHWRVNVEIKKTPAPMESFPIVKSVVALIEALGLVDQVVLSSFVHLYLKEAKTLNPELATAALVNRPTVDPLALLAELGCRIYHPQLNAIDEPQLAALREAGVVVNIWTVNALEDMKRLAKAGASGIITDYPQHLKPILAAI